MQQNLLNAEFVSEEYLKAGDNNLHVIRGMKALTKESRQVPGRFCCICACRPLLFLVYYDNEAGVCVEKALLSPPL